jgi:hypothetical protein
MDAATLYTIITLTSGEHRTSTRELASAAQCEQAAKLGRMQAPLSSKTQIYCIRHGQPDSQTPTAVRLDEDDD